MNVRVLHEHAAVKHDYHQTVQAGEMVELDSLGRPNRNAWRKWLVVVCNNGDCPGRAVVDLEDLAERVGDFFQPAPRFLDTENQQ